MKVIVLALLLAFSLEAQAQKAQEILVVATDAQVQSSTELVNAIKQHHTGVVTVRNELPEMLDYVAVMMIRPWGGEFNGLWLDSVQQARLIEYVQSGGKFYAEGADFRSTSSVHPDTSDNQFWDFIGDSLEGVAALEFAVDRVLGISGEFTEGLDASGAMRQIGTLFFVQGMKSVLQTSSVFGGGQVTAWASPYPSIRAILHWPMPVEYYDEFIARVVCTYFQLCELDVADNIESPPALRYDQQTRSLHLPGPGKVVISDILGRVILQLNAEGDQVRLRDLAPGTYLARWSAAGRAKPSTLVIR